MPRKLVGYGIGLVMIIVGALWTFGPGSSDGGVLVALGPIVAGFGVALGYVTFQRER